MLELSAAEFEVAWEALGLGDLPLIFRVRIDRRGATEQERAHWVHQVLDGLRARGLADERGVLGELAAALVALANPDWSVDARLDTYRPLRALGVAVRTETVIAVLADGALTLTTGTAFRLAADMAALAADHPPGPGASINLSADVLLAAAAEVVEGEPLLLADELQARGVPHAEARALARINAELVGSGQFGVEVHDRDGGGRRAPRVVGFCDTYEGRWAQLRTVGHGGTQWVTFTPAGTAQLTAMIRELLAECGVRAA